VQPEVLLVAFAVLMLIAAGRMPVMTMVASSPDEDEADQQAGALRQPARTGTAVQAEPGAPQARTTVRNALPVLGAGLVVGFLGVGGGFIIVGTSLVVISLNSAVALLARGGQDGFHWAVIVPFTLAAIAGSGAGKKVADRASGPHLTRGFAVL